MDDPSNPAVSEPIFRYCGLKNLNNSCWSNSILQALYISNKTRRQLVANPQAGPFHKILSSLFRRMSKLPFVQSPGGRWYLPSIDPVKFNATFRLYRPEFKKGQQHDAQEFLNFLIDVLHQETNTVRPRPLAETARTHQTAEEAWQYHVQFVDNSPFSKIFMGQIESKLTCLSCGHQSRSWTAIWQLQLGIPLEKPNQTPIEKEKVLTIKDCLQEFLAEETLTTDAAPTCSSCNLNLGSGKQQMVRQGSIYLIVHLKRFGATGQRIERKVIFDERLLLANRFYALSCCVLHRGTTESGHYTTLFYEADNRWTLFDDAAIFLGITTTQAHALLEDYGYIGFYRAIVI